MPIQDTVRRGRALTEKYMPLQVLVMEQGEGGTDPAGYPVEGEPVVAATTKGRLGKLSGSENVVAQRLSELVEGSLMIPTGVSVRSDQWLVVDGVKFNIRSVTVGTPQYMAQQELLVSRA